MAAPDSSATSGGLLRKLRDNFEAPCDAASLAAFRFIFGLIMAWGGSRYLAGDWLRLLFTGPTFHFRYPGFFWVPELPTEGLRTVIFILIVSSLGVAFGLLYRLSVLVMLTTFIYLELLDVTNYLNHHYLAGLLAFLLLFIPAHATLSIDSIVARRLTRPVTPTVPRFWIHLLRFQISVVYFYAGLAKFGSDWLLHGQPLQIWLAPLNELPMIGPLLALPPAPLLLSWCGFLYDTTIWLFLWQRRTRLLAYGVVLVFHTLTRVFFDIGLFPWIMSAATLIFFEPDWPRRFLPEPGRRSGGAGTAPSVSRLSRVFWAAYAASQVLVPLRHNLYSSDVLWEEDGMRFSWKVMIREKSASVDFVAVGQNSGKTRRLSAFKYLSPRQVREMGGQPDLIVQLAHHIGRELSARWGEPVKVSADARVSLNGRRAVAIMDPHCDLTQVDPTHSPLPCTVPHPGGAPARLR